MSEALRVAVFGMASWYSSSFTRALRQLGPHRVELVGATALGLDDETLHGRTGMTSARFGETFGLRVYDSADDLLDDARPQLVCVASPNTERPRYARLALRAGADVYVAKPMTATVAGAAEIRDAARENPKLLLGSLNPARFATGIRAAYERVRAGEIGEILTARAWIQHGAADPGQSLVGRPESADGQGGIQFSMGVYASDLLNWFIDARSTPAVRTFAEYDTLNSPGFPWMDAGKAVVRYDRGKLGSMDIYYHVPCPAPQWEIEVSGRDDIMRTNGGNYEGMIWRRGGLAWPRLEPFAPTRDDTILGAMDHVVTSCQQRTPFEMDAEDGYRAIELCVAWTRSAETHEPIGLPLDG